MELGWGNKRVYIKQQTLWHVLDVDYIGIAYIFHALIYRYAKQSKLCVDLHIYEHTYRVHAF